MRKNIFKTLTFAALFCILFTVSVFADDAVITGNNVYFRSGPSEEYAIYECLPSGTVVTVTDQSDSVWYAVSYNGRMGYINSSYLSFSVGEEPDPSEGEDPAEPTGQSEGRSGTVNAMYVRFRSGPSTDHSILGEYNRGTALTVTGSSGNWYAVIIDGQAGYMYADYVTIGGNDAPNTDPPAPTPTPTVTPPADPVVTPSGSKAGHIGASYVYFRSGPSTYYSIYDCLDYGTSLAITGRSGDWYAVVINGRSGYVYGAYVVNDDGGDVPNEPSADPDPAPTPEPTPVPTAPPSTTSTPGYITGNSVRFRSGPSTQHSILGEYNYGTALSITGSSGDWKAVIINGQSGYVYGQYVASGNIGLPGGTSGSELGRSIAAYALQFVGYNYIWGGDSPETGFDCSGLAQYVFGHYGIYIPHRSDLQAGYGIAVSFSDLQPGDLLCFYDEGSTYLGHVGIYIGDGRFVHASNPNVGVIISELGGYYSNVRGYVARRLI